MKDIEFESEVYRFFVDEIDTVPQMEGLLLLWDSRPRRWSVEELSRRLYVDEEAVRAIMTPLVQRRLVEFDSKPTGSFSYHAKDEDADRRMEAAARAYRRDLVRATTIIHSKASLGVREFARAFKLKKEPE